MEPSFSLMLVHLDRVLIAALVPTSPGWVQGLARIRHFSRPRGPASADSIGRTVDRDPDVEQVALSPPNLLATT
jgi:hypothetical protein